MKRPYVKPLISMTKVMYDNHLLKGSNPSKNYTVNADGENIKITDQERTDITEVDYSKEHNAWSAWDE